jgi:hypothetical protein
MSQYNQAQLISASNAAYVTNTSGLITAANVRQLNSDWISSSALVNQSNTFTGDQTIIGNLTASLGQGNIWVGNGTNTNVQIATASLQTNTGSLVTTASFNSFTQSYQTDSASFNSRINAVSSSGGNINTGSFITTGSVGLNQSITGNLKVTGSFTVQGAGGTQVLTSIVGGNTMFFGGANNSLTIYSGSDNANFFPNGITYNSPSTQTNINFQTPNAFIQSKGNTYFQNTIGGVGTGSYGFTARNGGSFTFGLVNPVSASGNFNFNAQSGAITLLTQNNDSNAWNISGGGNLANINLFQRGVGDIQIASFPYVSASITTQTLGLNSNNQYSAPFINMYGQYPNANIFTDDAHWPGNIFGGYNIQDQITNFTIGTLAANSYTPEYSGETVGWFGGGANNENGSNTAFIMRTGSADLEIFKPTDFNFDVTIQKATTPGTPPTTTANLILSYVSQSLNFANDTDAATGGVPLGGVYRNGNFLMIRMS